MELPQSPCFKVTNQEECHHGMQYKTGLVKDHLSFSSTGSCVPGGLYFTTKEHIPKFYFRGVWIRPVTLPTGIEEFRCVRDSTGDQWRANMLILGERHSLSDPQTYLSFGLVMLNVEESIVRGDMEVLEWWLRNDTTIELREHARNFALLWLRWSQTMEDGPLSDAAMRTVEALTSHCNASICASNGALHVSPAESLEDAPHAVGHRRQRGIVPRMASACVRLVACKSCKDGTHTTFF